MILPDINLLLFAYNSDYPHRLSRAAWWSATLSSPEPVCLCAPVIFGFIRLTTSRQIFPHPITIGEAAVHVLEWLDQPNVLFAPAEQSDVRLSLNLLLDAGTGGNLTTDAQIAAIARRLGAIIHKTDSDFGRFAGVRWHNPLAEPRRR